MMALADGELLGRQEECRRISGMLLGADGDRSGVLVVRGEAGIGKTALLEYAVAEAKEFLITRATGVESEMELGFAALHQLLFPFLDAGISALPVPQRQALENAFGYTGAQQHADTFMIGLASLSLLSGAAIERPMLCVVDDAQWLDRESALVLAFVARRMQADRVVMLFAIRDPYPAPTAMDDLPSIELGGLPDREARQLVTRVAGTHLDEVSTVRLLNETRRNPLGLTELARELSGASDKLGQGPVPLPLSNRLEQRFLRQVRELPGPTQTYLLVVAADTSSEPDVVDAAARSLGLDSAAVLPAQELGLVDLRSRVAFRHPLMRSAVYHGAGASELRAVHGALAESLQQRRDADRCAWHRAAATLGPDDGVADELAEAAERALRRGGFASSAGFLARSASLTTDPVRAGQRLLQSADAAVKSGQPQLAQQLVDKSTHLLTDEADLAWAAQITGAISFSKYDVRGTAAVLLDAATQLRRTDLAAAADTLTMALFTTFIAGRLAEGVTMGEVCETILETFPTADLSASPQVRLLHGLAVRETQGAEIAAPFLRSVIDSLRKTGCPPADLFKCGSIGGYAAGALGDDVALDVLTSKLIGVARDAGGVLLLSQAYFNRAICDLIRGEINSAEAAFDMWDQLAPAPMGAEVNPALVILAAFRGQEEMARAGERAAAQRAVERSQGMALTYLDFAIGTLELGLRNWEAARERGERARADRSLLLWFVTMPNLVEATVRTGDIAAARRYVDEYELWSSSTSTSLAAGLLARCQALVADDDGAEALYERSLTELGGALGEMHSARTHLVFGEWLRRRQRRKDARRHLESALASFDRIGCAGFAERSRQELEATGRSVPRADAARTELLTPQERQVARLASEGATNAEIGAQLYISAATVDYHLRKVFRKLDIRSRSQLGAQLPQLSRATAP